MDWQRAIPGIILLLVKLTGTSLFLVFIPHTFPRGNFSFVHEENWTESRSEAMTTFPTRATVTSTVKAPTCNLLTVGTVLINILALGCCFVSLQPTAAQVPFKPPKWERYRGNDYWFSEDMAVWIKGQMECQAQNSELVIITDRKELEFIYNKTTMVDYFIGLIYSEDRNKWLWNDGTEHKRNLFTMKPNEMGKECATVRAREVNPASCYQESRWICEKS